MNPPRWWNPKIAAVVVVAIGSVFAFYALWVLNDYVNRRWGP